MTPMTHNPLPPIKPVLNTRGFYIEHGSTSQTQRADFAIEQRQGGRQTWGYSSYLQHPGQKKTVGMIWPSPVPMPWAFSRFRAVPLGSYQDISVILPVLARHPNSPLRAWPCEYSKNSEPQSFSDTEIIDVLMEPDSYQERVEGEWPEGLSGGYEFDLRFGVYAGRHVLGQIGFQGCTAACTAMLILDRGGAVDLRTLFERGSAQTEAKLRDLTHAGLRAANTSLKRNTAQEVLPRVIKRYGPVIASLNLAIGNHCVVVDAIDKKEAVLRDPFHGWMIAVKVDAFWQYFWRSMTGEVVFVGE